MPGTIEVVYDWGEITELAGDILKVVDNLPVVLAGAVTEIGLFIEREAKVELTQAGGVVSGRLRASIGHGEDGIWNLKVGAREIVVYVGTNVEYAPYVEYGFTMSTPHVAYLPGIGFRYIHPFSFLGYHYMEKAAESARREAPKIIEKHLLLALGEAFG